MPKRVRSKAGAKGNSESPERRGRRTNSTVIGFAETAGRTLGRAVNAVEQVVKQVRRQPSAPPRKRANARKRR